MAPPSTPAQPRFLLPKSQKQKSATPLQSSSHQFVSTPRFNITKTVSRHDIASNQPPPFSTPAVNTARARATQYESLGDSIDTSPISSSVSRNEKFKGISLSESIEIESQSPLAFNDASEDEHEGERATKRRRVSISPMVDATPEEDNSHDPMALGDGRNEFDVPQISEDHQGSTSPSEPRAGSEGPSSPIEPSTRQPTFLSAPRFKTSEALDAGTERHPLPEAFSPQRRGAKYVTGGLAAEVRDWLVQVKGASEYDRPTGDSVRLIVDHLRHSKYREMCLISGDEVESRSESFETQGQHGTGDGEPARVILAGDGRISGLGSRTGVGQGVTVSMHQPIWDITLKDLGLFAVACDWEGESQNAETTVTQVN